MIVSTIVALAKPSAVMFISHSRKDSQFNQMGNESDLQDEARGSSYISGRMDTSIRFTAMKGKAHEGKGHMNFKGRAINEDKLPIKQDVVGLPWVMADEAKRLELLKEMLKEHGPKSKDPWSRNAMAKALAALPEMMLQTRAITTRLKAMESER